MSGAALALVLVAALAHATWNLFAKRAATAGVAFVWLYTCAEVVLYTPVAAVTIWVTAPSVGLAEVSFILGSAVLHVAYFVLLQRGYSTGELSLVYPVARGLGPLLAIIGAVLILGERPTLVATAGALAVCGGVFWLASVGRTRLAVPRRQGTRGVPALVYAIATGTAIGSYTLWDGHAMTVLTISPILFQWGSMLGRWALLTPAVWGKGEGVRAAWRHYRREALVVGALAPLSYILVLWAFTMAPVTYVAPAREFSIVIGTAFGAMLLGEGHGTQRLPAAALVVLGVVLLGVA